MKLIKPLIKIFIVCALLVAVFIASIALYVKFYGKDIIEDALSKMLGTRIKFENISLNLDQYSVNFKGFTIPNKIDFGEENIFNAEKFTLLLNRERFEKEKKIVFEEIIIKKATLNIERNERGIFNISSKNENSFNRENSLAYAQDPEGAIGIYNLLKDVRNLVIEDSIINFKDYYVPQGPLNIRCDNLNVNIKSRPEEESIYNAIPTRCKIGFEMPGRYRSGTFSLEADMSVLRYKVDMDAKIYTKNIDILQFLPYLDSYTPFSFKEGIFSSQTNLTIRDDIINSLTTMVFHRLKLLINPGMENARFLEATVNRLAPYLMSQEGEIIFDFVIKGPLDNPQIGLGPQVKFAIGLVVMEEVGNLIQQFQKFRGMIK